MRSCKRSAGHDKELEGEGRCGDGGGVAFFAHVKRNDMNTSVNKFDAIEKLIYEEELRIEILCELFLKFVQA